MTDNSAEATMEPAAMPRKWGRTVLIVAGVLVVALGTTAAIVVPRVLQSQRVEEYTALVGELGVALDQRAELEATLHAATALTYVRHGEALSVADAVAALGESEEPMLPATQAELLGETGASAAHEIGVLEDAEVPEDASHELLTVVYVESKASEEQARTEAEDAGDEVPESTLPGSLGELTVDQAIDLLAAPVAPEPVTTVPDEDVTDEVIEQMRASIASVNKEIAATEEAIEAETTRHEFLSETVTGMLPVLHETAAAIDEYLEAVEEQAAKAEEDVAKKTAAAAERVRDSADADDAAALQARIASYVAAGEASLTSHAEVVKAEEAEAKRLAEEKAAKERASKRSSGGGSSGVGTCAYFSPSLVGAGNLVLAPC